MVYQLQFFLEKKDLAIIAHALVISRHDYSKALYMGLPLEMPPKLQLVQYVAALY